jgi:5-methylcytosine-specific restriction enzyme B
MPPDARVLADWLTEHPPRSPEPNFGGVVVRLFERLNERLRSDLGPHQQVGHSYFMVPELDEERLKVVWKHHVKPLLDEYFAAQPQRTRSYDLDTLLHDGRSPRPRRRRSAETSG